MLKVTDFGCNDHNRHQLTLSGIEAELMQGLIYNLPKQGDFHTFICDHGNTHLISLQFRAQKLMKIASRPYC
jgi:hypothetical protein